ncbi:CAF17-like 4Fe-4S cluster assembly/insertion protein YgfZ [Terriglobus aquaticus]|uniref:YgfZ/GcvT domain-containing protein n=1 Tax=Terriglobus aquaticus TaxID=940139 RepID=A0ABW9KKC6_9BACT|nr:folate-binding protein [Terriglobus aquaticus]
MGALVPEATLTGTEGLRALRSGAGWTRLDDRGWIAVTGEDRVRWLNGMVTNSVQALQPGQGAYAFLLNAQGRIQGDATVWCEANRLLLETDLAQVKPMMELLDRFIIMDDVELEDLTGDMHGLLVAGPRSAELLAEAGLDVPRSEELTRTERQWDFSPVQVVRAYSPAVPRYEIWMSSAAAQKADVSAWMQGISPVGRESFELFRVVEGVPRFGVDIRDRDLPQETAQTRALHFSKGCYLGQEIVERIRSRGQVHRTFAQFVLEGDAPAAGTELLAEEKPVGVLTSVSAEPIDGATLALGGTTLALGYVRREAIERRLPLSYAGGTARVRLEALDGKAASNA